jgi:hypothetical protein
LSLEEEAVEMAEEAVEQEVIELLFQVDLWLQLLFIQVEVFQ